MQSAIPSPIFDPWLATVEQALKCAEGREQITPAPLAQRQAAQDILRSRGACLAPNGGCVVLRCLSLCGVNQLTPPGWLWDAFTQRHNRVTAAEVATWDEAFGRPWKAHTRLEAVRERRRLKEKVHSAAWMLAIKEPGMAIDHDFFERISEMLGGHKSGTTMERMYYQALSDGLANVALLRKKSTTNPQRLAQ
jgi:hypothetical protein